MFSFCFVLILNENQEHLKDLIKIMQVKKDLKKFKLIFYRVIYVSIFFAASSLKGE
jgi:hypothetical protein